MRDLLPLMPTLQIPSFDDAIPKDGFMLPIYNWNPADDSPLTSIEWTNLDFSSSTSNQKRIESGIESDGDTFSIDLIVMSYDLN